MAVFSIVHRAIIDHSRAVAAYKDAKQAFDELSVSFKRTDIIKWRKMEEKAKAAKGKELQKLYTASVKVENGMPTFIQIQCSFNLSEQFLPFWRQRSS